MSWLIVPVTIILLRGALMVLILAGAEALWEDCLSASPTAVFFCKKTLPVRAEL